MTKEERINRLVTIKQLFEEGYTSSYISKKLGINPKSMYSIIKNTDIIQKNKQRRNYSNDSYFNNIDTEAKAYLLGFFIADGYISEKRRICLNNSIDDISALELFQKEVCPDSKIYYINKQTGVKIRKTQVILRISSEEMFQTLLNKYKITKNKTHDYDFIFDFNLIPKELIRHFIRGFFDGDGSVSFYKTKNTIYFNFSFIFTSLKFSEQISEIFENLFNIKSKIYKIKGKTCEYYPLRFNYNRNRYDKIKEIYNWLYEDSNCFLERKKNKFNSYLEYRANLIDNTIKQCNA